MTTKTICPKCRKPIVCARCAGALGGKSKSESKVSASRSNGSKGGRPVTTKRGNAR